MKQLIHNDWWDVLKPQFESQSYSQLHDFLKTEYTHRTIYPEMHHIFEAFEWTPFHNVKVVILGQDPYHGPHQAHGCSFSVLPGVAVPPSLQNIYKELQSDVGFQPVNHGYLNSVLTVRAGQAYSHRGHGWEQLTDAAIHALSERPQPVVFILWGRAARDKKKLINTNTNIILESPHPSPLSANRGFFGSRPFSKTNEALQAMGEKPIDWQLPANPEVDEGPADQLPKNA